MVPKFFSKEDISKKQVWEEYRRDEIINLFKECIYGYEPYDKKVKIDHEIIYSDYSLNKGLINLDVLKTSFYKDNKSAFFTSAIYKPNKIEKPLPVIIMINPFSKTYGIDERVKFYNQLPYDYLIKEGYIAIRINIDEYCLDNKCKYKKGIYNLFEYSNNEENDTSWGAISMWSYGVRKVIDYLYEQDWVDKKNILLNGCSRAGKTALWTGALDDRVTHVISNVSGCTGAALSRNKKGEKISDILEQFPYWFCENYKNYIDPEKLPIDQHMLIALIAPRPVYVSSASKDDWADPENEFEGAKQASEIYNLYNLIGLENINMPVIDKPIHNHISYHIRDGVHGCFIDDWEKFLDFYNKFKN